MRLAALVLIGAAILALDGQTQDDVEQACADALEVVRQENQRRLYEGPEARQDLLRVIHQFQAEHPGPPACHFKARDYEVVVLLIEREIEQADSLLVSTFEDEAFSDLPPLLQSRLFYNKGYVNDQLGRLGDAAEYYYRAASLGDQMPAHQGVRSYVAAASVARDLNDPSAEFYLEAAERLLRDSTLSPERARQNEGSLLTEWTRLLSKQAGSDYDATRKQARYQLARVYADRAVQRLEGVTAPSDVVRLANALIYRVDAEVALGDTDAADRSLAQASPLLSGAETVSATVRYSWWKARAGTDLAAGRLDRALASSLQTEREAIALGREIAVAAWLARAKTRTGQVYERLGRAEDAEASYRDAIALAEVERDRIGIRDWTASSFASQQRPRRALARLLAERGRPWEAFQTLDAGRARVFRDLQASSGAMRELTAERRAAVETLADSLETVRVALATSPTAAARSAFASMTAQLQDSIQATLGRESKPPAPLHRAALQTALGDRVLLTYLLTPEKSLAFVVRADTFAVVDLDTHSDSIRAWGADLVSGWTQARPDAGFDLDVSERLYDALLAPVDPVIPEGAPLTIVPDPGLAQIPFAALARPRSRPDAPDYLVRHHAVTTELAAGLIQASRSDPRPVGLDLLALGKSTFEADEADDLPFVPEEVRSVQSHASRVQSSLDDEATETAFSLVAPTARVIHIASHAFVDPEIPLNTRILLSEDPDTRDDGTLFLHEFQSLALDADLVVLSGCSTAQGRQQEGEGLIGLQYGVRVAGARAALATLWPVDDQATVTIMDAFYDALGAGMSKDRALQRAQVAYLDAAEAGRSSPFFWAGAVLSGDPSPVSMSKGGVPWALGLSLAVLLAMAGLAWRFRLQTRSHA